jgi:hypothetical protein
MLTFRLVGERAVRELVLVVFVHPVLHIFEDRVEVFDTLLGKQAELGNYPSYRPDRESSPGKADKNDIVAIAIVGADEGVRLSDSLPKSVIIRETLWQEKTHLRDTKAKSSACKCVQCVAAGPDTRFVTDNLQSAVVALAFEASIESCDIGRILEGALWLPECWLIIAIIALRCVSDSQHQSADRTYEFIQVPSQQTTSLFLEEAMLGNGYEIEKLLPRDDPKE